MVTFNEAMLSNDRTLAIRVGDFTSENIKSANFKYGYITGDDFTPGGTYAGTASILFTSIVESFKKLDVVYPEIGLLVGSKVEWVKMGKYYIDDIKIDRNANTTEIELMDEMFKLNESFKTDLKYPAQIRDVILEIATKTGVTLATDNFGTTAIQQHVDEPTGDKLTYRDVLSQASQLLGFSCFFNRNGELEVRGLTESGITITADNYFLHGLEKSEVEYQIAGITCEVANDEKLTVGLQTGRSLEIENPLATQDTLNLLYYALKDIVYYPYDLSYQGHLKLDVGQWVTIKTNKNETFKVPVLYQSFSFSGGLTSTISADSVAGSDAQYTYGSFVTKKIDQKSTRIQAEVQQQLKYADEEFKKVSNEMLQQSLEYQNSVRNELATSKAELETQIDTAKTQAESNAKVYADEINQATSEVAEQANTTANSLKSDLTQVKKDLTTTTNTANAAKTSASEAKQQLTTVANDLSTAKQDLQAQASQLTAQANAQSELTKRVSTVEETANGTKTTVSELSKTVAQNGKDITSVTARTKTVEDDLTSTKTTLSQVKTTADSTSQKTATLETGLNGLNARFENLQIGTVNLLRNSKGPFKPNANKIDNWQRFENTYVYLENGKQYVLSGETDGVFSNVHNVFEESDRVVLWLTDPDKSFNKIVSDDKTGTSGTAFIWNSASGTYQLRVNTYHTVPTKSAWNIQIEEGNLRSTYSQNEADIESKVAEYKQTADQNYASLQSNLQTLDGTVKQNKSEFDQTASQIKSSISAVEGNIPSGEMNLVEYGRPADGYSPYKNAEYSTHPFYYNSAYKMYIIKNTATSEKVLGMNRFKVERNTDYTLYFKGFNNSAITHMDVWFLKRVNGSTKDYDSAHILVNGRKLSISKAEDVSVTFNTGNYDEGYIRFDNNGSTSAGTQADLYFGDVSVKKGKSNNGWSPSLAELASSQDLKTAQSEIKMTTDLISMNLSALDDSTVKSASLTINTDGIVMKAGKSTTDVANAIGAYFAVNQNAINLFSDKINVKGSMIVDGAITSSKIASKSINTAHLNGKIITADVISSNAVTADAIKAGAVTTDKMTANSINGDRITAGTLDAAKIKAGSITASQIASGTITSDQIKASTITSANIATGAITTNKIAASSIDASKIAANTITSDHISTAGITANKIIGGTLTATNDAMKISLTSGRLEFYTETAFIRRVLTNYPNQFISFRTGTYDGVPSGVTVIGSNRNGDENSNNGAFAGVRIWNGWNSSTAIDNIDLVGDTIRLVHSAASDSPKGWIFYNWNNGGSPLLRLYGTTAGQRAGSYIEAGDIHIMKSDGTYMSLKSILNTFNGNFSANGGSYYPNGI
ncbi:gp58-like protein [Streptococcus gallolyticus]|uniref:Gp58-like protein n=1 Tax=Streptococcus gallolyticus TaxID=315405 RepID=A0A1H7XV19_9STRE|nr:gp58-like family protein [Streptococcus gallolyticus]SEF25484.1 gp58-like protein [Streptococcus gallolyticus]SEM36839.1 gp58-like protein [Streptococcus gallolyticus]